LTGAVGQTDDCQGRLALGEVGLDLHPTWLEADKGMCGRASEHSSTVDGKTARVCADSALKGVLEPLDLPAVDADDVEGALQAGQFGTRRLPERRSVAKPLL
jgi:hypothetical protein